MATMLKPSLIKVDQSGKYFKHELNKIRFAPPSIFNQLKKLFIYLALLFVQEKSVSAKDKDIADKKELFSSLKTLLSSKEDNLIKYQSEVNKLKLMTLDFVTRRKSEQDNLRRKLKGKRVNSEKHEAEELERTEVDKQSKELISLLHEITAEKPAEHALMLKESYALLKMQPRIVDESEDEFQERLLKHTTKAISTASDTEDDVWLKYSDDAYEYLSKYSSYPVLNKISHLEDENVPSMKMSK